MSKNFTNKLRFSVKPSKLGWLFLLFCMLNFAGINHVTGQNKWKSDLLNYINGKLAKPDGGYGWEDQYDSHSTPTFATIGVLNAIGQLPKDKKALIEFVKTHHPQKQPLNEAGPSGTDLRNLVYEQIQGLLWLGGDPSGFKDEVSGWKTQAGKLANYETQNYPVLIQEVMTPICRKLLNLPIAEVTPEFVKYLKSRQRPNGNFNNAPLSNGGDGNILNTYWSLYTLNVLDKKDMINKEVISWINACQLKNGGFTHQPNPQLGNNDDVAYTWAAVKALQLLSVKPANSKACIQYLLSLRNEDGGFGNRPGFHSTPMSTYYAIDALNSLDALSALDNAPKPNVYSKAKTDFTGYKVYSVQIEASGSGSPAEAVMLAESLKIDLWGSKNAGAGWIESAQKIADEKKVPVTFFQADEPYGKNVHIDGLGTFGHILDYVAPAGNGFVPFKVNTTGENFRKSAIAIKDSSSWKDFRNAAIEPLLKVNGGLILQVANNEVMARIVLDESIKNGGYLGISTIHFGQNFAFWLPYLFQYRYQLPFVALQDAHGTESWWWSNELVSYRNLYLAKDGSYNEMIKALKNKWFVAVRHDSISGYKTRMLGGNEDARQFIIAKENSWKWWKEGTNETNHPWAAITVLTPKDSLEVGHPDKGVNIRIRCWWDGVRNNIKYPLTQLEQLTVDHVIIKPEDIKKGEKKGADYYSLYSITEPTEGKHLIEAKFLNLKTKATKVIKQEFTYKKK